MIIFEHFQLRSFVTSFETFTFTACCLFGSQLQMYQGSHLPNFEVLGVPNSKRQASTAQHTHAQTDYYDTARFYNEGISSKSFIKTLSAHTLTHNAKTKIDVFN